MNIRNTIIKHYRKFFDLHAKGIALTEDNHLDIDWAESLVKDCFIPDVSNCPDLTHLWNNASIKANKKEISIHAMNKVWGALRELERQGFCKLADSTYD